MSYNLKEKKSSKLDQSNRLFTFESVAVKIGTIFFHETRSKPWENYSVGGAVKRSPLWRPIALTSAQKGFRWSWKKVNNSHTKRRWKLAWGWSFIFRFASDALFFGRVPFTVHNRNSVVRIPTRFVIDSRWNLALLVCFLILGNFPVIYFYF